MSLYERLSAVLTPGTELYPYQRQNLRFIEKLNGRAIIGDDCGLGKTLVGISYLALHPEVLPAVIVCPASIKWKWQRELKQFAGLDSTVLEGFKPFGLNVEIEEEGKVRKTQRWFNSSQARMDWINENHENIEVLGKPKKTLPELSNILIVNYDILDDWLDVLIDKIRPKCLIPDESQKLKNPTAKRTKSCQQLSKICPTIIPLSGTPITNRPIEFFTALNMVDPINYPSRMSYAFRFCAPKRGWKNKGWDFSGASNLQELHLKTRKLMIRHLKSEVLQDLPPKVRSIIPTDLDNRKEYERARDEFIYWLLEKKGVEAAKRAKGAQALIKLGYLKQLSAVGKLPSFLEWADDFLEQTGEKLIIFAVNKIIVNSLLEKYPLAAMINGSVASNKRQAIADKFQQDPKCRVFIGNIDAAGVGINLTAASTVAFIQMGWTPAEADQAEDRALRIGQLASKMNAYYFLGRDTVDEDNWELVERKRKVVGAVLDGDDAESIQALIIDNLMRKYGKDL